MAYEVTDRDRHGWQREAAHALTAMLTHGYQEGLPSLQWTIATTGALVGNAPGLGSTPAGQRAAFEAWADYLRADRWPERTNRDGLTHLHARFTWDEDDRVRGAIRADIWPADSDDHN